MIIAVDFDGTCVDHHYPLIGREAPEAVRTLIDLTKQGHQLILWTMRSGQTLEDAVEWFTKNDIRLHAVQKNPTQSSWTSSNKCLANIYIDDAALGAPLIDLPHFNRPCIDWLKVRKFFQLD
jgi:hypothetical protein